MGKKSYSEAEELLKKELHNLKVSRLLDEADRASGKKPQKKEGEEVLTPRQIFFLLKKDLKWLHQRDKEVYKTLKIKKSQMDRLTAIVAKKSEEIDEKELHELTALKEEVEAYKKKNYPPIAEDKQVQDEKKKHIYKRHKVSEKWLPLDTHSKDWL